MMELRSINRFRLCIDSYVDIEEESTTSGAYWHVMLRILRWNMSCSRSLARCGWVCIVQGLRMCDVICFRHLHYMRVILELHSLL